MRFTSRENYRFLKRIDLNLIHIRNNFGYILDNGRKPTVLEMTFSSNEENIVEAKLPHRFDMPNNNLIEDLKLVFSDK